MAADWSRPSGEKRRDAAILPGFDAEFHPQAAGTPAAGASAFAGRLGAACDRGRCPRLRALTRRATLRHRAEPGFRSEGDPLRPSRDGHDPALNTRWTDRRANTRPPRPIR